MIVTGSFHLFTCLSVGTSSARSIAATLDPSFPQHARLLLPVYRGGHECWVCVHPLATHKSMPHASEQSEGDRRECTALCTPRVTGTEICRVSHN